jgi:DNA repair protein RecO (recombination protein O)
MAIIKTEGVVLKSFDFRETSRIATLFTKEAGKVSGVLKGIRKDPRKFGSSVERFSVNDIVYYQYRNSDLHLISQCDMKAFYYPIRQNLKKSLAASYILELVYKMMPAEETNTKVYHLMLDFLERLQRDDQIASLVHIFQIKVLLYSGFRPHLDACVKCKAKITQRVRFSLKEGGLICPQCPFPEADMVFISPGTIASLLFIESHGWEDCMKLKLTQQVTKELKYVLNNFLVFHLGKKINSAKYVPLAATAGR